MILAPCRPGIEKVQATLLAPRDHQLSALVIEDRGGYLHIEIFLEEPFPVRRDVPVLELQLCPFDARTDQPVAVALRGEVVLAVTGWRPRNTTGVDGSAGASPESSAARMKGHDLLLGIGHVNRPNLIRIPGASLRCRREDDVVPHVQRIGLPVGITERDGRRRFIACAEIELVKCAVAGKNINGSSAGSLRWPDDRSRCQTAWTQGIGWPAAAGRGRIVEALLPQDFSAIGIDGVDVVRDTGLEHDLFGAVRRRDTTDDQ